MRTLIQRVQRASVTIDGQKVANIGKGMLILVGVKTTDTTEEADFLADKCATLRIFEDNEGKMNLDLSQVNGDILVVSQFTLYGDARKGRRPSYIDAAPPPISEPLYEYFVQKLREKGFHVETGHFGADMKVELVNDGPVTILAEKEHL